MFNHPDDVGGQFAHLLGSQCGADGQAKGFACGDTVVHEGGVLCFVAAVVTDEALTCGGDDLVVDELLFIEAIADAFPCLVGVKLVEHVVR